MTCVRKTDLPCLGIKDDQQAGDKHIHGHVFAQQVIRPRQLWRATARETSTVKKSVKMYISIG
jgi:hypothetical protein